MTVALQRFCLNAVWALGLLAAAHPALSQTAAPGSDAPTPADPYPLYAAGWGLTQTGANPVFVSRWAEDWSGMRAAGKAPPLKAMPLSGAASLTLNAEARLFHSSYDNGLLALGNDFQQDRLRGILGADLRLNPNLRLYGEIGAGQVQGRRIASPANLQNDAALQQLFADVRGQVGPTLVGVMAGRQEFSDGPRQLLSVGDGASLHRTWNGVRLYAHGQRFRLGAFDLRATRLGRKGFDDGINHGEQLQGINAGIVLALGPQRANIYLDPFWTHSENPSFGSGGRAGLDNRNTYGTRFWGRRGPVAFDWTLARQTGHFMTRAVDAWALFAVQSLALSDRGGKPRLVSHLDVASGGGAFGNGTLKDFNQLYAASNYLGDGLFLSASNLSLIAPGIAASPTATTSLSIEWGFARRREEGDAAYGGQMRAHAGTQNVPGHEIGGLLRINTTWLATARLTLSLSYEHLAAGDVLKRAHLPSGSYGSAFAAFRY